MSVPGLPTDGGVPLAAIVQLVADRFELRPNDIHSARRDAHVALARHVAWYLARTMTDNSLPVIARCIGGRDHTSVMHGVRRINELIKTDEALAALISILRELARQRMVRRVPPLADGGIVEAKVICTGLLDGSALPETREALIEAAIAALTQAKASHARVASAAS